MLDTQRLWVNTQWLTPDVGWSQNEMMIQSVIPARLPFCLFFEHMVLRLEINTFAFASMFLCVSVCRLVFIALYVLCAGLCGCLGRSVCSLCIALNALMPIERWPCRSLCTEWMYYGVPACDSSHSLQSLDLPWPFSLPDIWLCTSNPPFPNLPVKTHE